AVRAKPLIPLLCTLLVNDLVQLFVPDTFLPIQLLSMLHTMLLTPIIIVLSIKGRAALRQLSQQPLALSYSEFNYRLLLIILTFTSQVAINILDRASDKVLRHLVELMSIREA